MAVRSLPFLYMTDLSPPVRSVLLTARLLGVSLRRKELDLRAGENRDDSYVEVDGYFFAATLHKLFRIPYILYIKIY